MPLLTPEVIMQWLMNFLFGSSEPETKKASGKSDTDQLLDAIEKACLKPIKKHLKACKAAETEEELLPLMHPQAIAEHSIKSCRKVARLVAEHVEAHAREFMRECGVSSLALEQLAGAQDAIEDRLVPHLKPLRKALEEYAVVYRGFCKQYEAAWDGLMDKANAWAEVGGALGRAFGPWGDIIGTVAGGYFAGDDTGKKVKASGKKLDAGFNEACEAWESCMVSVQLAAIDVLKDYHQRVIDTTERLMERQQAPRLALPAGGDR
jgi:hypothetical protein